MRGDPMWPLWLWLLESLIPLTLEEEDIPYTIYTEKYSRAGICWFMRGVSYNYIKYKEPLLLWPLYYEN